MGTCASTGGALGYDILLFFLGMFGSDKVFLGVIYPVISPKSKIVNVPRILCRTKVLHISYNIVKFIVKTSS